MSVRVRFVVDGVAMGHYFYGYFRFLLSVTLYQFSVSILIHMMLLPDEQTGEAWEYSNKLCCFGNRREFDRKVILLGNMFGYIFYSIHIYSSVYLR